MAVKKSDLYSSLWRSCDALRGGMDASQYKDYVLTLLFLKYVSDRYAGREGALVTVPDGATFDDVVALKGDKEIGDKLNIIVRAIEDANRHLLGGVLRAADFNSAEKLGGPKEMTDKLTRLVGIFEGLDLSANRAVGDDLLGDAYEYLMRHFATESGKSKGQFYTPAEVSRVIAKVVGIGPDTKKVQSVYDPTCGSGSLLLKASDEAPNGLSIFGQEMDNATFALARMNMVLHDDPTAVIAKGNSLADPQFTKDGALKRFDFVVANPPFSYKAWRTGFDPEHDPYGRFTGFGIPPSKQGDYAFLLHVIGSLKSDGRAAVVLPHGVLFRGNAEGAIREQIVRRGLIRGIIGLPANLFYGTGIPACLVVIDREHAEARKGVFMVDASRGFRKDGNKNRLREQDIHRIVDVFTRREDVPGYARLVPTAEIAANGYNLNLARYIDAAEAEDLHDLDAHLNGGLPDRDLDRLADVWDVMPGLRAALVEEDRPGYSRLRVSAETLGETVHAHPEFRAFADRVRDAFRGWRDAHRPALVAIAKDADPKAIIGDLSEDLLARFAAVPLVDPYSVYQRLMDYWAATMQDDVYLIAQDGWRAAAMPRPLVARRDLALAETPDLVVGRQKVKLDLIPAPLVVARYFAAEQKAVDQLAAAADEAGAAVDEFVEEHAVEDGLLGEARSDTGKVTAGSVKARLADIGLDPDAGEERQALQTCSRLMAKETAAKKKAKDAQSALDAKVLAKYPKLTDDEIKTLAVADKWLATMAAAVETELGQAERDTTQHFRDLHERYGMSVVEIAAEVADAENRVARHFEAMRASWN